MKERITVILILGVFALILGAMMTAERYHEASVLDYEAVSGEIPPVRPLKAAPGFEIIRREVAPGFYAYCWRRARYHDLISSRDVDVCEAMRETWRQLKFDGYRGPVPPDPTGWDPVLKPRDFCGEDKK